MTTAKHLFLTLAALAIGIASAHAHAFLDSSEPAVGSTVHTSPLVVKIWFTKQIVKDGSSVTVSNAGGTEVDLKDDKIEPADKFLMTVSLPPLPSGTYKVVWNAVCTDSHHTTGSFRFTVTKE